MVHFCNGCMRLAKQDVCEYCGWTSNSTNGDNALPAGLVIDNRYVIGGLVGQWEKSRFFEEPMFREGRRFNSYSKLYYAWDKRRNQRVELEEFYPSGSMRTENTGSVVFDPNRGSFADDSILYASLPLFMKMGNSPSRWCGIKGIEKIYDFFDANGTWFIVREAADAICLRDWLQNENQPSTALTMEESVSILEQLVDILSRLKKMGLSHGGICADNLYIKSGNEVLLRDFENLGFKLHQINDWIYYDDAPIDAFYSPYYPNLRNISNRPSFNSQYRDIYAICCIFYSCATWELPKHSGIDFNRIFSGVDFLYDLSDRQRGALAKGLCVEDKVWYDDVEQFKKDFFYEEINNEAMLPQTPAIIVIEP